MKRFMTIFATLAAVSFTFSTTVWAKSSNNKATEEEILSELESLVVPRNGQGATDIDPREEEFIVTQSTKYSTSTKNKTGRHLWGINIFGYFSGASHIQTDGSSNSNYSYSGLYSQNTARSTGEYRSSVSAGIGAEHSKKRLIKTGPVSFGYDAGAAYELGRTVYRDVLSSGGSAYSSTQISDPTLSFFLPYAHMNMSYGRSYVFGGINYSIPQVDNAADENYDGTIGYQAGFGSRITSWVALEMVYRVVNFTATSRYQVEGYSTNYSNVNRQGLGVVDAENLSLSGLNMILKVMF